MWKQGVRRFSVALFASVLASCSARAVRPDDAPVHARAPLFQEMMERVNAGDAAGYAKLYALDARITIHGSASLLGRAAIERHEVELLAQFPGTRFAISALWQDDERAVAHYAVRCPNPPLGHEGLLFYRFGPAGLVVDERRYLDSRTMMAQLGLLGAAPARAVPEPAERMATHVARGVAREGENAALVRASLRAFDAHDEEAWLATLAEDVVLDDLVRPEPITGKAAASAWFQEWAWAVPDLHTEVVTILAAGDHVLLETMVRGTLNGVLAGFAAEDRPFVLHRGIVATLADGRITRLAAFWNAKELAEPLGEWPPEPAGG